MPDLSLPHEYAVMPAGDLALRARRLKAQMGSSLCILGHHYQADEVVEHADYVGDSLRLSQVAAGQSEARFIVFCGVHFMAESADILTRPDQVVCLPNVLAGCAMADMADDAGVESAMEELSALAGPARIVPVTYVNSTAATKAVTARFGGACCTSSNVANVFSWALAPAGKGGGAADKILAVPDQHLGRNTAVALGYSLDDCVVYDPHLPSGGLDGEQVRRARFILWKGQCYVHQIFRPSDIPAIRRQMPGVRVIVHPECPYDVVALADESGSTEQIIRAISDSPAGTVWAVGTEANLVNRLARRLGGAGPGGQPDSGAPARTIRVLADRPAHCVQMARITLGHLVWVLDSLAAGNIINRVSVPPETARHARVALERMIAIPRSI